VSRRVADNQCGFVINARYMSSDWQRYELAPFQLTELHALPQSDSVAAYRIGEDQVRGSPRNFDAVYVGLRSMLSKKDFQGGLQAILIQDKLRTRNFDSKNRSR
jgi:hypothetical protein